MLYKIYELQRAFLNAGSATASIAAEFLADPRFPPANLGFGQPLSSALEVFAHAAAPRGMSKP